VGQVVEDEDEVGLDEGRGGSTDRVTIRQWDGRLERGHRVVGERTHGAAREPRHPFGWLDATARDEAPDRIERIGRGAALDREIRGVAFDRHRSSEGSGDPVAKLEQPPRPDAQEGIPTQSLAALDGLEEVGRRGSVVEPEERPDRRLEIGRAGRAQQERVGVAGETLCLGQTERIGCCHRACLRATGPTLGFRPRNQKRPVRPGTKGRAFRGATLIRRSRTS